jgi:hypothetical protein
VSTIPANEPSVNAASVLLRSAGVLPLRKFIKLLVLDCHWAPKISCHFELQAD